MSRTIFLILMLLFPPPMVAGEAAPAAKGDPAIEARAYALESELRCLVCQNQTLADSNAPLAVDLRNQIREKMKQGASDRDILDFMVERYGDFVLYRPPVNAATLLLWLGPLLLIVTGLLVLYVRIARRPAQEQPLSDAEREQAAKLLAEGDTE